MPVFKTILEKLTTPFKPSGRSPRSKPSEPAEDSALTLLKNQWDAMAISTPNAETLSQTLDDITSLIKAWPNETQRRQMRSHIKTNFNLWKDSASAVIRDFNAETFAQSLTSMARLHITPPGRFMRPALKNCTRNIDQLSPKQRQSLLWSFSEQRIRPGPDFITAWERTEINAAPEDLHPEALLINLQASAKLRIKHSPEYIAHAKYHITRALDTNPEIFNDKELINGFWASALLDSLGENMKDLGETLHAHLEKREITEPQHFRQHYRASHWFDLPSRHKPGPSTKSRSVLEVKLQEAFNEAGFVSEHCNTYLERINHTSDIALKVKKNKKEKNILVEVDGYGHLLQEFNEQSGRYRATVYNGATLFNSALIRKFNRSATTVHITTNQVRKILEPEEKKQKALLYKIAYTAHGLRPDTYGLSLKDNKPEFEQLKYSLY